MRFLKSNPQGANPMPPTDLRCTWMTAGVLSYQLCDRQFACEDCPLDRAMRTHFTPAQAAAARQPEEQAPDARYTRNHFWLTKSGDATWRAAIEPRLALMLPPVKSVVLPAAGDLLDEHAPAAWIVFDDGTLPLVSPGAGKVLRTNEQLRAEPHLIASPSVAQGWLFEIAVSPGQLFSSREEIGPSYDEDDERFRALVAASLNREAAAVGPTLPDGGSRLDSLITMVGLKRYCEVLALAYSPQGGTRKK